jgi:hypothetical protein
MADKMSNENNALRTKETVGRIQAEQAMTDLTDMAGDDVEK